MQNSFFQVALLSLGFGAWVLGSRLSHVANSVFNSLKPKLDAHVAKIGIASILQVTRNPVQTDILHLSGVVWIINWETIERQPGLSSCITHPITQTAALTTDPDAVLATASSYQTEDTKSSEFHISSPTPSTGERVTDHQTIFLPCRKGLLGFIGLYPAPESWISTGILSGLGCVMLGGSHLGPI